MTKIERNFVIIRIAAYEKFIQSHKRQAEYGTPLSSMAEDMASHYIAEAYEECVRDLRSLLTLSEE